MASITKNNMAPLYSSLCDEFNWDVDADLLSKMSKSNEEEVKSLDDRHKDAVENFGETEVNEALLAKADFFARIGDLEKALAAYDVVYEKTTPVGQRLNILISVIRMTLRYNKIDTAKAKIDTAKELLEQGGDWEKRNRIKVYEGTYFLIIRDFKKASSLLLESLATFTSTELLDYNTFIMYSVVSSMLALERVNLKKKVIDSPEVLTVIRNIPYLSELLNSLYDCEYNQFFVAISEFNASLLRDVYLRKHTRYIIRELRSLSYVQFLESYKSVTMVNMASTFGVSTFFLDKELSRFISAGRLNAKIDKVGGIVETNRPDAKNAQYQTTIKEGDLLLNRIQKLAHVISM